MLRVKENPVIILKPFWTVIISLPGLFHTGRKADIGDASFEKKGI